MTIDPASSTDLDQALFIDRSGGGYKVFYAIADVPSFVAPGGALDAETRRRGQTFYTPDGRIPLHPEVISEEAGSLLAGQLCAAFVWEFELDAAAEVSAVLVRRAHGPQPGQAQLPGRAGRARRRHRRARAAAAQGSRASSGWSWNACAAAPA